MSAADTGTTGVPGVVGLMSAAPKIIGGLLWGKKPTDRGFYLRDPLTGIKSRVGRRAYYRAQAARRMDPNVQAGPVLLPGPPGPILVPGVPPWVSLPVLWTVIGSTTSGAVEAYKNKQAETQKELDDLIKKGAREKAAADKKAAADLKKAQAKQAKWERDRAKRLAKERGVLTQGRRTPGGTHGDAWQPAKSSKAGGPGDPPTEPGKSGVNVTVNMPGPVAVPSPGRADAGLYAPKIYRRYLPMPAALPAAVPAPPPLWKTLLIGGIPTALPALSKLLGTGSGKRSPKFTDPLTGFNTGGASYVQTESYSSSAFGPPAGATDTCSCDPKKKRGKKKRRTICYKGSYVETATGLQKHKRERIQCRA